MRTLRVAYLSFAVLLMSGLGLACRRLPVAPRAAPDPLQIVRRTWSARDTGLTARARGRLVVVVRSADAPLQALPQARLQLAERPGGPVTRAASADSLGTVSFDSLSVGSYAITVSRLGYARLVLTVPVERGCRTDLEVYIGLQAIGIAPSPPTPARAVATLCPVDPANGP